MKFAMYTSALAITVALAGCSSSSNYTPPAPDAPDNGGSVTPTPPTPPAGHSVTNTYDNNAADRTKNLTRTGKMQLLAPTGPGSAATEELVVQNAKDAQETARGFSADLANVPNTTDPNYLAAAQAIVNSFNALDGTGPNIPVNSGDDIPALVAKVNGRIDDNMQARIALREQELTDKYLDVQGGPKALKSNKGGGQTITLADGTQLATESMGYPLADKNGAFVGASVVAAYELDNVGNIKRVAFVETTGPEFTPDSGVGSYVGTGKSTFAVKVDDGFFNILDGDSKVNINIGSETGNVTAVASGRAGPAVVGYKSNVVYNPSTGEFTSSNGQFGYAAAGGAFNDPNTNVLSADNAKILGQLHGELGSTTGAHYTGLVTADTNRIEAVGSIIGHKQ